MPSTSQRLGSWNSGCDSTNSANCGKSCVSFMRQAAQEGHAALVAAVAQHLHGLHARVQQRQEPPVLGPRVVRETVGAPIGGEPLVVAVLDQGIDARVAQQIDPSGAGRRR